MYHSPRQPCTSGDSRPPCTDTARSWDTPPSCPYWAENQKLYISMHLRQNIFVSPWCGRSYRGGSARLARPGTPCGRPLGLLALPGPSRRGGGVVQYFLHYRPLSYVAQSLVPQRLHCIFAYLLVGNLELSQSVILTGRPALCPGWYPVPPSAG